MPVLTLRPSTSSTHTGVDSAPVPAVVGTATSGLSGPDGARPSPTGWLTYSIRSPGLEIIRFTDK
jgi:hypothetical protein